MKTRNLLPCLGLAALCATAACSNGGGPTGPGDNPPPPPPAPTVRYDMTVVPRFVRASSEKSCDGDGLFGAKNAGEYQFRITASYGGQTRTYETNNYGTVTGSNESLEAGETGNFPNQSWTFSNMNGGNNVSLKFYVTEWDGLAKDDYMDNRSGTATLRPSIRPNGGTERDRELFVGVSTCGLSLFYDVTIVRNES